MADRSDREVNEALDRLRQSYPDPLRGQEGLDELLRRPDAQALLTDGEQATSDLLAFLRRTHEPDSARVAVVLISRLPAEEVYAPLLESLGRADARMAHSYEPGLWLVAMPEERLAADVVRLVESTGNPHPLLVLQRPAARHAKAQLHRLVERRELPLSRYAFAAYRYAVDRDDAELLTSLTGWKEAPDVAAWAGLALLEIGSPAGRVGVAAGLRASDEELRATIAYELSRFLPEQAFASAGYDSRAPTDEAVRELLSYLPR